MSDLVVRKIPFAFDGVEFFWHPGNPEFSFLMNLLSFQAIGFERYICKAMREAEKLTDDPAILREIRDFNAQEMVHSNAHRKHVNVLIDRYPALQEALDQSMADFETLWKARDLQFHLAYTANIEATFLPLFGTIIDHRDLLFGGGDARISSLMLWHFCEEIEHRSSALVIYDHVIGKSWYRLRKSREVFAHIAASAQRIAAHFARHVPGAADIDYKQGTARLPKAARRRMSIGLLLSQLPWHNPDHGKVPAYYGEWRRRYEAGEDMRMAYTA